MFAGRRRRGSRTGLADCGEVFGGEWLIVACVGSGVGFAKSFSVASDLAVVVDAFAAESAGDAGGFVAGHLARVDGDGDPLFAEEVGIGHLAVGEHLLLILVFYLRIEFASALFG